MTVQKTQIPSLCPRCGVTIPAGVPGHRSRKWCSERCREITRRDARIEAAEASGVRTHDDDGYFTCIRDSLGA
jgi:endogenous inhibitor of DNA gyrase (YacG/DUF329 family)